MLFVLASIQKFFFLPLEMVLLGVGKQKQALAKAAGLITHGPLTQRTFLSRLGIEVRAMALLRSHPDARPKLLRQLHRLLDEDEMGQLFKAVTLSAADLPPPLGFS